MSNDPELGGRFEWPFVSYEIRLPADHLRWTQLHSLLWLPKGGGQNQGKHTYQMIKRFELEIFTMLFNRDDPPAKENFTIYVLFQYYIPGIVSSIVVLKINMYHSFANRTTQSHLKFIAYLHR